MKSKEEIEQLALNHANEEIEVYNLIGLARETKQAIYTHCLVSYNIAYTQCQQDMADKKYTEEDLMSAFNAGINNDYGNGLSFDQWLNSLNKQD